MKKIGMMARRYESIGQGMNLNEAYTNGRQIAQTRRIVP
jgi:hypothetical protein